MVPWQVFEKCYFLSLLRVRKHSQCIKWPFLLFELRTYIFNRKARDLVLAIIANTLVKDIVMDTGCMLKWHESSVMVLLWICYGGKQRPTNPNRHTTVQKVQEMRQRKNAKYENKKAINKKKLQDGGKVRQIQTDTFTPLFLYKHGLDGRGK